MADALKVLEQGRVEKMLLASCAKCGRELGERVRPGYVEQARALLEHVARRHRAVNGCDGEVTITEVEVPRG